jgi:hypothetical protein
MTAETDTLLFPFLCRHAVIGSPRTYISVSHVSHLRFPAPDGQMTSESEYSSSAWKDVVASPCYHALGRWCYQERSFC